jgi:hypothetical protein
MTDYEYDYYDDSDSWSFSLEEEDPAPENAVEEAELGGYRQQMEEMIEGIRGRKDERMDDLDGKVGRERRIYWRQWMPDAFDPATMHIDPTITFIGRRRSGKTFYARMLAMLMRLNYPRVYVFTRTKFNGFWSKYIPNSVIADGYDPTILKVILEEQKKAVEEITSKYGWDDSLWPTGEDAPPNPYTLVIMDDILGGEDEHNAAIHEDQTIKLLYTMGRHYKIAIWMLLQDHTGITRMNRDNTDYAFIFQNDNYDTKNAIAHGYMTVNGVQPADAMSIMDRLTDIVHKDGCTGNAYQCKCPRPMLVIDRTSLSLTPEKRFFVTSGRKPDQPFLMGCEELWEDDSPEEAVERQLREDHSS